MRAGDPVGVGRRYEPLWMGSSVWRACILDANAGPSALSSMVRTWDPGRDDAVSRPSASLPYTLFWGDALAAQLVLVLVLAKATTWTEGCAVAGAWHTGTLALQSTAAGPVRWATQRRVACSSCSSLADHTARPPLTVGISAVLERRLPTDRKLARLLQCTRAASAQCCPASAAHDSTSPPSNGDQGIAVLP